MKKQSSRLIFKVFILSLRTYVGSDTLLNLVSTDSVSKFRKNYRFVRLARNLIRNIDTKTKKGYKREPVC